MTEMPLCYRYLAMSDIVCRHVMVTCPFLQWSHLMRLRRKPGDGNGGDEVKLAIQELVRFNRLSELGDKLTNNPQLANQDVDGIYPLHIACEVGSGDAIEMLLDNGADMNCLNPSSQTPLDICYHNNHQKTSIMLLQRGAQFTPGDVTTSSYSRYHGDVLETTKNCGRTLLHWAARQGNTITFHFPCYL